MVYVAPFIAISCYVAAAAFAAAPLARPLRAPVEGVIARAAAGNGYGLGISDAARYLFTLSVRPDETETTPSIKDSQLRKEPR